MQIRATVAVALFLGACGGGTSQTHTATAETEAAPPPPPSVAAHARGDTSVSARVGSLGGTLELANGARLEIDPNVLSDEIEITMRSGDTSAAHVFDNAETQTPLGPVVDVEPAFTPTRTRSIHFSVPATRIPDGYPETDLALAIEEAGNQRDLFVSATQTRWQMYPARHAGERFTSDLDEIAGHRMQFGVSR